MSERWSSFDSAPRDGSLVIVWREDAGVFIAQCQSPIDENGDLQSDDPDNWLWFTADGEDLTGDLPTAWMPLPGEPAECGWCGGRLCDCMPF